MDKNLLEARFHGMEPSFLAAKSDILLIQEQHVPVRQMSTAQGGTQAETAG